MLIVLIVVFLYYISLSPLPPQSLSNIHNPTKDQKPLTQPLENVDIMFSRLLPVVWR